VLGIFKQDVSQQAPPKSLVQRLEDAHARVNETKTHLLEVNKEIEEFAHSHNLFFDELGGISTVDDCVHWPPEVASEYKGLSEKRNEALREFYAALQRYADLKN